MLTIYLKILNRSLNPDLSIQNIIVHPSPANLTIFTISIRHIAFENCDYYFHSQLPSPKKNLSRFIYFYFQPFSVDGGDDSSSSSSFFSGDFPTILLISSSFSSSSSSSLLLKSVKPLSFISSCFFNFPEK